MDGVKRRVKLIGQDDFVFDHDVATPCGRSSNIMEYNRIGELQAEIKTIEMELTSPSAAT